MDEEQETQKKTEADEETKRLAEERAKDNAGDGAKEDEEKKEDLLTRIKSENERIEKNIAENKKIIEEQKRIAADAILAGRSGGGGGNAPELTKEEIKVVNAKDFWKGTALGEAIAKTNE